MRDNQLLVIVERPLGEAFRAEAERLGVSISSMVRTFTFEGINARREEAGLEPLDIPDDLKARAPRRRRSRRGFETSSSADQSISTAGEGERNSAQCAS